MTEQTATQTDPVSLQAALNFTDDDLIANRDGRLSEMQDYRLRVRRRRSAFLSALVLIAASFVATLLLFLGTREGGSSILTLIGIGVTLCNAALFGAFARHWMRLNADIQKGEVHALSGTVERVVKPVTRRVVNYVIRIDSVDIVVDKDTFDAFAHQKRYTIYRTPFSGALLSGDKL